MKWDWDYCVEEIEFENVCTLASFKSLDDQDYVDNFVYDRISGLVFLNFHSGYHNLFMEFLYLMYSNISRLCESIHMDDAAESYLIKYDGVYKSSVRPFVYKWSTRHFNSQEKFAFANYNIHNINT